MNEQDIAHKIHGAAIDLLDDPGIKLDHDDICSMLLSEGAKEGRSTNVIRFPKEQVMENRIDNGLTEDQVEALDNLANRFLDQL